ncbi:hypothetical protein [Micromonospora sp. NBC_00421]|uniref:hypothetical protein n=1 Tax=Micromonospora sp. NBC_00421 TaxID=2975976 RepID=UPI002E1B7663
MTEHHSIEVTAFFGDEDTYRELHLIGPYPTPAARDRDLIRLERLPGNNGDALFTSSDRNPADADHSCTPEQVADIRHFNQVVGALYGYEVDDNGQDVRHPPTVAPPARPRQRKTRQPTSQGALFDPAGANR